MLKLLIPSLLLLVACGKQNDNPEERRASGRSFQLAIPDDIACFADRVYFKEDGPQEARQELLYLGFFEYKNTNFLKFSYNHAGTVKDRIFSEIGHVVQYKITQAVDPNTGRVISFDREYAHAGFNITSAVGAEELEARMSPTLSHQVLTYRFVDPRDPDKRILKRVPQETRIVIRLNTTDLRGKIEFEKINDLSGVDMSDIGTGSIPSRIGPHVFMNLECMEKSEL